jgi:hypothetical protein
MSELVVHGETVKTVFDLIGTLENDITKSIAWALVKCPQLLDAVAFSLTGCHADTDNTVIRYQVSEDDKGITDLEIEDYRNFFIIIEAKRGWELPGYDQLHMYSEKESFKRSPVRNKMIVSMSECSDEYAKNNLPVIPGTIVKQLSWKSICNLVEKVRPNSANKEKYVLDDIERYIKRIMTTQNKDSNRVYVVSLGLKKAEITTVDGEKIEGDITYLDIVKKYNRYCCPVGGKGGWPKEPPNYIAFRYNGKLQSIHHIEGYDVSDELYKYVPELPHKKSSETHFIFTLGPAIIPQKDVKTGKSIVRSNRVWVDIDTLLTSDTISQALEITKSRE